jgi:hypothetical protein
MDIKKDELRKDIARYVDQKAAVADWHSEQPDHLNVRDICAKYPGNSWCTKFALLQAPNVGADVQAQMDGVDPSASAVAQSPSYQNDTVAFLRGMRDAMYTLKSQGQGVRGLHHWHGWHNGDTWDFWDAANARSSRMIQLMMHDQGEDFVQDGPRGTAATEVDKDPYMSADVVADESQVHMMVVRQVGQPSPTQCLEQCGAKHCLQGSEAQIGGKHLTGSFCTHNCSMLYGGNRFCGVGVGYQEGDAIDCGGCANPPMCSGLPCWAKAPVFNASAQKADKSPSFLNRRLAEVKEVVADVKAVVGA